MTIPNDYFQKSIKFLNEYHFLYDKPNTHLLAHKVTQKIPADWAEYFQSSSNHIIFNNIASCVIDETAPASFQFFLKQISDLKQSHAEYRADAISLRNTLGLNHKKVHEILNLAPLIHSECRKYGVNYVVDIGAGLGYLPQLLFDNYNYKILGIEGNDKYVQTATKQQTAPSRDAIKYKHLFVKSNSADEIDALLRQSFPNFDDKHDRICIIALHACADLSVHMINIFKEIPYAKCAVIMPCCYHRLAGDETSFVNFPLSGLLKEAYCGFGGKFLTRPFLRLACQQSCSAWMGMSDEEHKVRARNCLLRNILQEVVEEEGLSISRQKRKTGSKLSDYTIDKYLSDLEHSYKFTSPTNTPADSILIERIKNKILNYYTNSSTRTECLIRAICAIQVALQGVCEDLILLDRCAYANELALRCCINKVTNDSVSPRCFALLASKG